MKRVVFVDDERTVLDSLKLVFYPLRHEWQMAFATSGRQALDLLDQSDCDVLVTDLRMPGMSGLELLARVVNLHPRVVRMVLSDNADQEIAARSASLAHYFLVKPCDAATLRAAIERAFSLRTVLDAPAMRQLVSGLRTLPSVPSVYLRLMEVFGSPDVSPKEIAEVIGQDMIMTAKVLQLVNSACFGIKRQIANPTQAVIYLGAEIVRQLVLVASTFSAFHQPSVRRFSIQRLQDHSLAVGGLARRIAQSLDLSAAAVDYAFVGGLLHDVGKLLLACNYPEKYDEALRHASEERIPDSVAEVQAFGTTHAEVGTYLLWSWALPDPVAEVVLRHHEFPTDPACVSNPAVAVHVADALVNGGLDEAKVVCLTQVGLGGKLAGWQQLTGTAGRGKQSHVEAHPFWRRPSSALA